MLFGFLSRTCSNDGHWQPQRKFTANSSKLKSSCIGEFVWFHMLCSSEWFGSCGCLPLVTHPDRVPELKPAHIVKSGLQIGLDWLQLCRIHHSLNWITFSDYPFGLPCRHFQAWKQTFLGCVLNPTPPHLSGAVMGRQAIPLPRPRSS